MRVPCDNSSRLRHRVAVPWAGHSDQAPAATFAPGACRWHEPCVLVVAMSKAVALITTQRWFPWTVGLMVATAAYLQAQGITHMVASVLVAPPPMQNAPAPGPHSAPAPSAAAILARNP